MRSLSFLIALLCMGPVAAEEAVTVLPPDADHPPREMLQRFLLARSREHFAARKKAVAALKGPEEIRKRQATLKDAFVRALGGFPEKTPLRARTVRREEQGGYVLERVIYESRPDHHVTAHLYLPPGKGPFPGVLLPCGHSLTGKSAAWYQQACILLARNGLAALCYDPIGQGERIQLLDDSGKPAARGSTTEHTLTGVGALLVGGSTATYRIWDGIRSLDYMAARPEIDPKRLGCTGVSGGGTLTSYLMALDDRIVAAAPSCYITSLQRLFETIGPQDAEQNIPGQVAFGMDHADYLTLRAPRPTLVLAATQDFFDIDGTWDSFREAKLLYGKLGHSERIALAEFDTKHGYPQPQREAMVRWMRRWLLDQAGDVREGEIPARPARDLWCTRTGNVLEDFKGKSVFALNAERARELTPQRVAFWTDQPRDEALREIRRLIGLPPEVPAARARERGTIEKKEYTIRKIAYETEPGITVPALLYWPAGKPTSLIVRIHGEGMAADASAAEERARAGHAVLTLDPRGFGETAPGKAASGRAQPFGVDFKETFLALHLNRPLLGQRAFDVLAVLGGVAEDPATKGLSVHLVGTGKAGPVALHAAALDDRVREVTLEQTVVSWEAVARTALTRDQLTNVVPGVLARYDLPDLAASLAPRPLTVRAPTGAAGEALPGEEVRRAFERCRQGYARQGARDRFQIVAR